jgi:omega-6 fatty acid desaturase (delta-12 desaturase)
MLVSLWKSHRQCVFIEEEADVAFYKNYRGQAVKVGVMSEQDSGVDSTLSEASSS